MALGYVILSYRGNADKEKNKHEITGKIYTGFKAMAS